MSRMDIGRISMLFVVGLVLSTLGCPAGLRNKQLEKVAKDWALVIRASQVIPVYPLTEDLQPGDVLLVDTPIEEQIRIYKSKGFLPLDQHIVRLYCNEFADFYNGRYGTDDGSIPPKRFQTLRSNGQSNWDIAPHAAFPSYQFSVETGSGLSMAIPIKGIPFAMGLLNSGKASGTVTIAEAYTYGLDNVRLEKLVRNWADSNRILLRNYDPIDGTYQFLRVISRVYVTGRVDVSIKSDDAKGLEAAAGASRPNAMLGLTEGSTSENFKKLIDTLNLVAKEQLPGARLTISSATSRTVSLTEEFAKPLVIGYLGADFPIRKGGRLGAPISTLSRLSYRAATWNDQSRPYNVYRLAAISQMLQVLKSIPGTESKEQIEKLDQLDKLLPKTYTFSLYSFKSQTEVERDSKIITGSKVNIDGFQSVIDYIGYAQTSLETLRSYPATTTDSVLSKEYRRAVSALDDIHQRLNAESALLEAIDFVFLGD